MPPPPLHACIAGFDEADYCKRVYAAFGPGTAYDSKAKDKSHSAGTYMYVTVETKPDCQIYV